MTVLRLYRLGDPVGIQVSSWITDFANFPDFATGQTLALGALDPRRVVSLLRAADVAVFFTREEPRSGLQDLMS